MFDGRAEKFCNVTSHSDFAYLCRKLRERGAAVSIVGKAKAPNALRNASDQFFEWISELGTTESDYPGKLLIAKSKLALVERRPRFVVEAVSLLANATSDVQAHLPALGQYLKRTDPAFTRAAYGHAGLVDMLKTYDLLVLTRADKGYYTVKLAPIVGLNRASPMKATFWDFWRPGICYDKGAWTDAYLERAERSLKPGRTRRLKISP